MYLFDVLYVSDFGTLTLLILDHVYISRRLERARIWGILEGIPGPSVETIL